MHLMRFNDRVDEYALSIIGYFSATLCCHNNELFFDDIVLKCQQWSGDHTNADGELRENADHPPVYFYLIGWSRRIVLRSVLH